MKKWMLRAAIVFCAFPLIYGCATTGGSSSAAKAKKVVEKVDDSKPWNASSQIITKESPSSLWKKLADPESWNGWNSKVGEASLVGAELTEGAQFSWSYNTEKVDSTVETCIKDKKLVIKGTAAGVDSTMAMTIRDVDKNHCMLVVKVQIPAGWEDKKKDRDLAVEQLQSFLNGLK